MVVRRSFPFGAKGLFSGAFAVGFREGNIVTSTPRKKKNSSYHNYLQQTHFWYLFLEMLPQFFVQAAKPEERQVIDVMPLENGIWDISGSLDSWERVR